MIRGSEARESGGSAERVCIHSDERAGIAVRESILRVAAHADK